MSVGVEAQIDILQVDSDESFSELICTAMERQFDSATISRATAVEEGVAAIERCRPDCVVAACGPPDRDGVELLRTVREEYPKLPAVLYADEGSEPPAALELSSEHTDVLRKRAGSEQLADRIREAVESMLERRRAERRRELLRRTELDSDSGGFELDVDAGRLLLTEGTRQLAGFTDATCSLEALLELHPQEQRDEIRRAIDRAVRTGTQTGGVWRYRPDEGDDGVWDVTFTPVDTGEDSTTVRGAVRDVTGTKRAHRQRQTELRFNQQALDALADLFYVLDEEGRLLQWNERLFELTEYTEAELYGMDVGALFPPEERETIEAAIERALSAGDIAVEAELSTPGGRRVPFEFSGARLSDAQGNTTGLAGFGRDLTERRTYERRFRALVERSNDIISVVDREARFQYQSPSVERVLGYDPEETVGDLAWEYIHPDDRETAVEEFGKWIGGTGGSRMRIEYRARHADGSWRWMETNANDKLDDPAVEGYILNSRDITSRKQRQEQLELIDRVLRHNLRNGLNVIRGEAESIQVEGSGAVAGAAERIISTSETLNDTAQKERAMTELLTETPEHDDIAVGPMLRRAVSTVDLENDEATVEIDSPEGVTVRATERLADAVEELVTNAVVHNDARSPVVEVSVTQKSETIRIEVADNGPHIPEMERSVLLEETEQTPLYHGSGLGLWLVKLVVSRSGGTVSFETNSPNGNVVRLELPRNTDQNR